VDLYGLSYSLQTVLSKESLRHNVRVEQEILNGTDSLQVTIYPFSLLLHSAVTCWLGS